MPLLLLQSYLIGSIPFAYILAWICRKVDIRQIGSTNVGSTNVFRHVGVLPGIFTACFDICKGIVVVWLGRSLGFTGEVVALISAMIGHIWPIWLGFHGGGGLATLIGGLLVLSKWWLILAMLGVWGIIYRMMRSHDLSALVICMVFPIVLGLAHLSWDFFLLGVGAASVIGTKRVFSIKRNKCIIEINECGKKLLS